jgi:hypothetical protein
MNFGFLKQMMLQQQIQLFKSVLQQEILIFNMRKQLRLSPII